ncbi:Ig-like domain-containing protein [Amycolatopsis sp. YIM 10]|uniref:L,D-transpeptidase n=1 Tax=Amycolatopsis sp. YIM 10 TaxID=2653857 RepID=UPI0012A8F81E|nr:Ig-like domain-containing protein [Amycolatopsis sp. YIM 10]QFU86993.1 Putative L,D-transpeptidase LppS precursor [Amycolatopsis sp. YIM 10]
MSGRGGVGRRPITGRSGVRLSLLAVAAGLIISGCTSAPGAEPGPGGGDAPKETSTAPPKPVSLALTPAQGAADVAPGEPVRVNATDGKLNEVKLTNAEGKAVAGQLAPDGAGWVSTEPLGYGKSYTLTATGTGTNGQPTTSTSAFNTAKPARQTTVSINAQEGETVGVGMPLIFTFGMKVADKAAAEKALEIKSEPQVEGAFHWFSDTSVIWRPKDYWPSGTKVSVKAAVYGKNLGNGTYGKEDRAANFTIGDKLVAVADGQTFQMKVSINDQEAKVMPISMGKKSSSTPNGTYTVMSEHTGYTMDSSTYGVPTDSAAGYRTFVQYAVRMSNSGIFYHSAPWSVGSQGKRNVSHGCINLSTENAKWMMETSKKGDIITVQNGGEQTLAATDGWSVWQMSWDDWKSGGKKN